MVVVYLPYVPDSVKSYKIKHLSKGLVADTGRGFRDPGAGLLPHDILEHPVEPHPNPIVDEFMAVGGKLAWKSDYRLVGKVVWFIKEYGKDLPPLEPCPDKCPDERIVSAVRDEDQAEDIAGWIWRGSELFRERFGDQYRTVYRDLGGEIVRVVEKWRERGYATGWKSSTAVLWVGEEGVKIEDDPHPVLF